MATKKAMAWMRAIGRHDQQSDHQQEFPRRQEFRIDHIRLAVGFFPKCLAWYLPRMPVGLTSGAGPRGSFS